MKKLTYGGSLIAAQVEATFRIQHSVLEDKEGYQRRAITYQLTFAAGLRLQLCLGDEASSWAGSRDVSAWV